MGLLSSLFGGSSQKSTSTSSNVNNDLLKTNLSSTLGVVNRGAGALEAFLGGDTSGFDAYKKATGFDWLTKNGSQGILGGLASRGLLRSGAAGKALVNYGNDMSNQYAQNYLQTLFGLGDMGLKSAGILADSGRVSNSTSSGSSSTGGLGKAIGSVLTKVPFLSFLSDRRLKTNVEKVGQLDNGLGVYEFEYTFDKNKTRYVGVMADEVRKIQPEALGEQVEGYDTVRYDKIEGWPE